jgi:hypothetical protein
MRHGCFIAYACANICLRRTHLDARFQAVGVVLLPLYIVVRIVLVAVDLETILGLESIRYSVTVVFVVLGPDGDRTVNLEWLLHKCWDRTLEVAVI